MERSYYGNPAAVNGFKNNITSKHEKYRKYFIY
jgi:hypothetical protein